MRVTKQQQAKNRDRLVRTAGRMVRRRGVDGVGVDALAKAAGVTHGAVYSHFRGKDELAAAAIAQSLRETAARWRDSAGAAGPLGSPAYFNELIRHYVSRAHRDHPEEGCAVAALAADARRHGRRVRRALSDHVAALSQDMTQAVPVDEGDEDTRAQMALVAMTMMVGAVVLARGVEDSVLSDRILLATRRSLTRPSKP